MRAKLQKLSANKDNMDSIQFRVDPIDVEKSMQELMQLRRYDHVKVNAVSPQAQIDMETGEILVETEQQGVLLKGEIREGQELDESAAKEVENEMKMTFPQFEFQSMNTSISVCPTEEGWIVTLTFSFDSGDVFDHVITNRLRNQYIDLEFREGENPYA